MADPLDSNSSPQKLTINEFAGRIRERRPDLAGVDDKELVDTVLKSNPEFRSYLMDAGPTLTNVSIGAAPPMLSSAWFRQKGLNAIASVIDSLPAIGGGAGALLAAPEGGPVSAVGGAGLGAMGGSYLKSALLPIINPKSKGYKQQSMEDITTQMMTDSLMQAAIEGLGQVATGPLKSIGKKALSPDNIPILNTNAEHGLNLTGPELLPGPISKEFPQRAVESAPFSRSVAEQGRDITSRRATAAVQKAAVDTFGSEAANAAPNLAGKEVQNTIERIGNPVYDQQVESLRSQLSANVRNLRAKPIDIQALRTNAMEDLAKPSQTSNALIDKTKYPKEALNAPQLPAGAKSIIQDIARLKDNAPIDQLIELRSRLMKVSPQMTELMSNETPGTAKHYVAQLTDLIDRTLGTSPAGTSWRAFRNFTRKGADVFESQEVTNLLTQNPERFAQQIGPQDITGALKMRRAIDAFSRRGANAPIFQNSAGSLDKQQAAAEAWNKFRAAWFQEHIAQGDILKLSDRINSADPRVLSTILGSDAEGKLLIQNMSKLGVALDRMSELAPVHSRTLVSMARGAGMYPIAKLLYNPKLTDRVIRTATYLTTHPEMSPANATRMLQIALSDSGDRTPDNQPVGPQ